MFLAGAGVLGVALLYPNLMTVPSDAAHPTWRSAGMGVYRMWRDSGYAVGTVLIDISMEFVAAEDRVSWEPPLSASVRGTQRAT